MLLYYRACKFLFAALLGGGLLLILLSSLFTIIIIIFESSSTTSHNRIRLIKIKMKKKKNVVDGEEEGLIMYLRLKFKKTKRR